MAKMLLDNAHIPYRFVDAEENVELTKSLNIVKAPTLVVNVDGKTTMFDNASLIKGYIESLK